MFRMSVATTILLASLMSAAVFASPVGQGPSADAESVARLAAMAQLERGRASTIGQSGVAAERIDDAKGNLHVPTEYRAKYRYLGTWAIAGDEKGSKEVHVVYASPGAVEAYLKTGHFPDGAALVKEVFATKTEDMTTGTVSHEDTLKGWFIMVRDSKSTAHPGNPLWGDGWGWSWFDADQPTKTTSTDYKSDCQGCHIPASATDWIYVQGYPSLRK